MPLMMPEFKPGVTRINLEGLASIQDRYNSFMSTKRARFLDDVAMEGSREARVEAEKTMVMVREVVGL